MCLKARRKCQADAAALRWCWCCAAFALALAGEQMLADQNAGLIDGAVGVPNPTQAKPKQQSKQSSSWGGFGSADEPSASTEGWGTADDDGWGYGFERRPPLLPSPPPACLAACPRDAYVSAAKACCASWAEDNARTTSSRLKMSEPSKPALGQ